MNDADISLDRYRIVKEGRVLSSHRGSLEAEAAMEKLEADGDRGLVVEMMEWLPCLKGKITP